MASDFSSGCTEAVDVLEEKEEGEISLEDVSSSEEGHLNYGCNSRNIVQCPGCSSVQHCAPWCTIAARSNRSKTLHKKDAVQEKENRHLVKGPGCPGGRHASSTLQEKNDDLIPISSDSDMELVGLVESTHRVKSSKVKKKRKKRRPRSPPVEVEDESAVPNENRLLQTHHREKSPSHKTRSSPRRHRSSPVRVRPVVKKVKSPAVRARSTVTRKSLRKIKSPGRSPHKVLINPLHKKVRKHSSLSKFASSPTSDVRVTRLLKKVRQLEMVGTLESDKVSNKTKEHGSSLKEKLNNILKTAPENNENTTTNQTKEDTSEKKNENVEEEEDLNVLRQKALETKQNKMNKNQESLNAESDIKESSNNEDDDDDDEDLKLRLLALQSAVYKKHYNRVQREAKSPKKKKVPPPRTESPFSESFINNVSVAEDDDESLIFSPQTSPRTSSAMKDCMSLEDMELDSDLEKDVDLDQAPYSPTDEVNSELILEAEQLGIDATDVSLININSQVPNRFSSPLSSTEREVTPTLGNIYCSSNYSATTLNSDFRYPNSQSTLSRESPANKDPQGRIFNAERPYSPSDAPLYDPDLTESLLPQNETLNSCSTEMLKFVNNLGLNRNNLHASALRPVEPLEIEEVNLISHSMVNSLMPNDPLITIDDLSETDIDGSPLVPMEKDSSTHYHIPEHLSYQMLQPSYQPLYLSNVPYDVSKIPTLNNRSLVPPPVLRVNKQLQKEPKKPPVSVRIKEAQTESILTSLSGQRMPMDFVSLNSGVHFKSIKQTPLTKQQDANSSVVFDQFREDSVPDTSKNQENIQQTNKNLSVNTHKEKSPVDPGKKKNKNRRKSRRSSKRRLKEPEDIEEVENRNEKESTYQIRNSLDRVNEPAKGSRILETERRSNEKVLDKNVEIVTKSKDNKLRKSNIEQNLVQNVEKNVENNLEKNLQGQKIYDPHNNNITIVGNRSKTPKNTTNEKATDEKLCLSKNNLKDKDTNAEAQKDSETNAGSRRKSIDEDEEALRAILLASMAKRTKISETTSKPTAKVSKVATTSNTASNLAAPNIIQTRQMTSLSAAPKKSTEIAPKKPTNLNSSAASAAKVPPAKVPVNNSEVVNSILGKRKASSVLIAGSPRKFVRRAVIPASTKVVNNAKRYQNSLMQKRLNLQKANMAFNAKRIIANRSLRVLNHNQSSRSISPNVSVRNEGERFIINLNSDSETDSESGRRNTIVAVAKKSSVEKCPPLTIPTTEFERSVDQFLRDVRKKHEIEAATKHPANSTLAKKQPPPETPTKTGKAVTLPATPLAVRHLPAFRQEEYHRLKKQILEREKLNLQRISVSQQTSDTITVTLPGPLSPAGPTASSKQKAVSAVVTKNLPKTLSVTKNSPVDNSTSVPSSILASQAKSNLTIKIRNDGISPNKTLAASSLNIQNSAQGNAQEQSKVVAMPKLRILTCEQVNMKLLQIQVKQREDGRKVIVGELANSPRKNNISPSTKKSEPSNQNTAQREIIKNSNCIVNETPNTITTVDLEASANTVSKSKESDKSYDSQASTVILSNNETIVSNESRANKTIDSEASTVVLSQSNTTVSSDNNVTINSTRTTTINISQQLTPVDFGKGKQISVETPETGTIPPTATSTVLKEPIVLKEAIVTKKATVTKKAIITKEPTVTKGLTFTKESNVTKEFNVTKKKSVINQPNVTKDPTVSKASTVSKPSIDPKLPIVSKPPTFSQLSTVSKLSTVVKPLTVPKLPTEETTMNSVSETSSTLSKSIEPAHKKKPIALGVSKSEETRKEKTVTQNESKLADREKCHEVWDVIKTDVQAEVEKVLKLREEEQRRKLVETEQELVAKRYVVLDDLAEVSGSLRQWELEKDLQANLAAEVKKLREQLREAEEKLQEQKDRVTAMGSKVATVHEKMNIGRKECFKLAKVCTGLGSRIVGQKYKVPEAGVQLVNNRLKEVAQHTSQLCKKKNEKKRRLSEPSEKSYRKQSKAVSEEREKSRGPIERQNSCESLASCGRDSNSESQSSSETVIDQPEIENSQEHLSEKESESIETQSFSQRLTLSNSNSEIISQPIVEKSQKEKEKEDPKDSCEANKNLDSSSRKENYESVDTCHKPSSTQKQNNKADEQSNKQPLKPYVSILTHLRSPRNFQPDGILCPYQLMGSCHDGECQFIHYPPSH